MASGRTDMNPSESAIQTAVDKLKKSPGRFQRLAEHYAQVIYAERFKNLIPSGRNPQDVAVKGWPDAYALLPDCRVHAVEATHSSDWRRHLEKDLKNADAFGTGRLAGFLFIAWASAPSVGLIQEYRDRFVELGVPAENVTFVFRQQLVRDLSQPRFASVWVDLLQLRCDCYPFHTIGDARVFGRVGQVYAFAPTKDEYIQG